MAKTEFIDFIKKRKRKRKIHIPPIVRKEISNGLFQFTLKSKIPEVPIPVVKILPLVKKLKIDKRVLIKINGINKIT